MVEIISALNGQIYLSLLGLELGLGRIVQRHKLVALNLELGENLVVLLALDLVLQVHLDVERLLNGLVHPRLVQVVRIGRRLVQLLGTDAARHIGRAALGRHIDLLHLGIANEMMRSAAAMMVRSHRTHWTTRWHSHARMRWPTHWATHRRHVASHGRTRTTKAHVRRRMGWTHWAGTVHGPHWTGAAHRMHVARWTSTEWRRCSVAVVLAAMVVVWAVVVAIIIGHLGRTTPSTAIMVVVVVTTTVVRHKVVALIAWVLVWLLHIVAIIIVIKIIHVVVVVGAPLLIILHRLVVAAHMVALMVVVGAAAVLLLRMLELLWLHGPLLLLWLRLLLWLLLGRLIKVHVAGIVHHLVPRVGVVSIIAVAHSAAAVVLRLWLLVEGLLVLIKVLLIGLVEAAIVEATATSIVILLVGDEAATALLLALVVHVVYAVGHVVGAAKVLAFVVVVHHVVHCVGLTNYHNPHRLHTLNDFNTQF